MQHLPSHNRQWAFHQDKPRSQDNQASSNRLSQAALHSHNHHIRHPDIFHQGLRFSSLLVHHSNSMVRLAKSHTFMMPWTILSLVRLRRLYRL
jgi:hypothetical protein